MITPSVIGSYWVVGALASASSVAPPPPPPSDAAKVADTDVLALSVTLQVTASPQPPPSQPVKVEPPVGVAVNATTVPTGKLKEQVPGQAIPAGTLPTVP